MTENENENNNELVYEEFNCCAGCAHYRCAGYCAKTDAEVAFDAEVCEQFYPYDAI